ncbi:MAG TPA: glycerate dehydrogenase [Planctomycetaceae bacterium]|nr:glycerate dehydrogenase [Planctomycetaceae bacterium]
MARIVVLDGYALNPGDLSWGEFEALGRLTVHDRSTPVDVLVRAAEADVAMTNKVAFDRRTIDALPRLKYIGVFATGYNVVDLAAAAQRGIVVTNVPAYSTASVAQMVFSHLLNLAQPVAHHAEAVRLGRWTACEDFCFWEKPLIELDGLTMGIVGFGQIGRATARIARAMGMNVLVHDVFPPANPGDGIESVDLDTLFGQSDVVSLHCPLNEQTEKLVDAKRLAQMKPTAFLINTGRGQLVDERALADALNADRIAGAGIDVLADEPPPADSPLLAAKNCHVTPHIAWATRAARARLMTIAAENVRAFLAGNPRNVVDR